MKKKEIVRRYPRIKSRIFGSLSFTIPFKFIFLGVEIDEKMIRLFVFGFTIKIIRRNKYV